MKKYLLIFVFTISGIIAFPQTAEIGLFGGLSYYLGDLNPAIHFLDAKPAYGVMARVNFDTRWTVRADAFRGRIAGSDHIGRTNPLRGLEFESKITDICVTGEFNFFDYFTGSRRNQLTPFIFGGVGVVLFNPTAGGIELKSIGTEGQNIGFDGRKPYSLVALCIPFGIGFKYSLNKRFCMSAEWGMRKTYTDYLDDVSTTYYMDGALIDPSNPEEALSDPTFQHKAYQERGNPGTRDWYNFTGVSLTYKFRLYNKNKCPDKWKAGEDK